MNIGYFLKKIRSEKKLTLNEVAEKTNITGSLLSQIENGKASPSITSLEAILKYYKVNMSDFFKQVEGKDTIFQKFSDTEAHKWEEGSSIILLASKLANNVLESFMIMLKPGKGITIKDLDSDINGERFIYIQSGTIDAILPTGTFNMTIGDSLNFKSFLECVVHNTSKKEEAVLIINGTPPLM